MEKKYMQTSVANGKYQKTIAILVLCIIGLALIASLAGLFVVGGAGEYEFTSINGETIKIYGKGLYENDSVVAVSQGMAADFVTLVLGIPLLLVSLYLANKNSFRAKLMLTGTLGYFLYTYMSYVFLWMYNRLFIVYVMLLACSLFAFVLSMMSFHMETISSHFKKELPIRFLGGFQIFIAIAIGMLWLGRIAPSIISGEIPVGLEHYSTLVIQGMDLGIVVPAAFLSGILLIKRKPFGFLLSSVIILKGVTMLTAISAMIINQALNGVEMNIVEVILFPAFNLLAVIAMVLLLKNCSNGEETAK